MNIRNELEALAGFLPVDLLLHKIALPLKLLPEEVTHLVPCIVISSDGLSLDRLALFTSNYLCDVRLAGTNADDDFDFVAKHLLLNYRVKMWKHEIKEGEIVKASYDVAEVQFTHSPISLYSTVTYAGNRREEWLHQVLEAVPVNLVLAG